MNKATKIMNRECSELERRWNEAIALYEVLSHRYSISKSKKINKLVQRMEKELSVELLELTDEQILILFEAAYRAAIDYYWNRYGFKSPLLKNGIERRTGQRVAKVFEGNPLVKVLPRIDSETGEVISKYPLIGPIIPDTLVLGVGGKGSIGFMIEDDGEVHDGPKIEKDTLNEIMAGRFGITPLRHETHKYQYRKGETIEYIHQKKIYLEQALGEAWGSTVKRRANTQKRFDAAQRKIHLLAIAAWLSPLKIDSILREAYKSEFNLGRQIAGIIDHPEFTKKFRGVKKHLVHPYKPKRKTKIKLV